MSLETMLTELGKHVSRIHNAIDNDKPLAAKRFTRSFARYVEQNKYDNAWSKSGLMSYAWPGGYPLFYLDNENSVLCPECATKALSDYICTSFRPVAADINYEDKELYCAQCSERIESAYADDTVEEPMRQVSMRPYKDQSISFTLKTWETNETTSMGKSRVRYELTQKSFSTNDKDKLIFSGDDFGCSPLHAIDSDECLRALLSFLSLRPGDTDKEYFESYTQEQLDFANEHGETLSMYAQDEDPTPFDETDQEDEDDICDRCGKTAKLHKVKYADDTSIGSIEICDECEDTQNDDQEDEPDEDSITTSDHITFYQYGKVWLEVPQDISTNELNAMIRNKMDEDQFWPSVWFISDHGNAHLMNINESEEN